LVNLLNYDIKLNNSALIIINRVTGELPDTPTHGLDKSQSRGCRRQ